MATGRVQAATLLWDRIEPSGRGRTPVLTHGQIARAAVAIADDQGLDELSVRSVAQALGVGVMTLYRYVAGRSELEELMVDVIAAEQKVKVPAGASWREAGMEVAQRTRASLTAHPWVVLTPVVWPGIGPGGLQLSRRCYEAVNAAADAVPVDRRHQLVREVVGGVVALVLGYARQELAERRAATSSELPEDQRRRLVEAYLAQAASGSGVVIRSMAPPDVAGWDRSFVRLVDLFLGGLENELSREAARTSLSFIQPVWPRVPVPPAHP